MAGLNEYSAPDRLLHRLAFLYPGVQLAAAEIEDRLFHRTYAEASSARPIFIVSLPRAGTTILLNVLARIPDLGFHSYRDMPFLMAPLLWSRSSGPFRRRARVRERAHGDCLEIGYDSPEAFEEAIWRAFWRERHDAQRIKLRSALDRDAEGESFLRRHFRKIVALRSERTADGRYLSKNNGNLARLDLLFAVFPDASVLVPIREPLAQSRSLLRQHRNFLELHARSPFTKRYMRDLGHFEFGALHRPIDFDGFDPTMSGLDPQQPDYWLAYWIAAFEHVLDRRERLILVSHEHTCRDPAAVLAAVCAAASIDFDACTPALADGFRLPKSAIAADNEFSPALVERARSLHSRLLAHALAA